MTDERNLAMAYEVDVRREISEDFLEDAHGALYQARVQDLVRDLVEEGYDLNMSYRFGPGTVSLIVGAAHPEPLHELASVVSALGYELPEPYERTDQSPEELDGIRARQAGGYRDLEVSHRLTADLSHRLAGAMADVMRGELISSASRADLKSFANDLDENAYREERLARAREENHPQR